MAKIFVSYRRQDTPYLPERLKERLEQGFGKDSVFLDIDNIPIGVDFQEHIELAIQQCDVMLVLISDAWATNMPGKERNRLFDPLDYVRAEIEAAFRRKLPIVPLLVEKAQMPRAEDLPESIQKLVSRNAAELRAGSDFNTQMNRLIEGLKQLFPAPSAASAIAAEPRKAPQSLPAQSAREMGHHGPVQMSSGINSSASTGTELASTPIGEAILKHFGDLKKADPYLVSNLHIRYTGRIPQPILRDVIQSCGFQVKEKDVVLLYEFGPRLLLTDTTLFWRFGKQSRLVDFKDVTSIRRMNRSRFLYVNDEMMSFSNSEEVLARAVADFLEMLAARNNATAATDLGRPKAARSELPRQKPRLRPAKHRARVRGAAPVPRSAAPTKSAGVTSSPIRKAILKTFAGLKNVFLESNIPEERLRTMREFIAPSVNASDIVLLYDPFPERGDRRSGVLLTEIAVFWRQGSAERLAFEDIESAVGHYDQRWPAIYLNGRTKHIWPTEHDFAQALEKFLTTLAARNPAKSIQPPQTATAERPRAEPRPAEPPLKDRGDYTATPISRFAAPAASAGAISSTREAILEAFAGVNPKDIFTESHIPERKLRNALASYAAQVNVREVVLLHDDTLFGNAKTGFLLTETALFWRKITLDAQLVAFKDIQSVERHHPNCTIIVNGRHLQISPLRNDVVQAMEKLLKTLAARNRK